jgi:transposase
MSGQQFLLGSCVTDPGRRGLQSRGWPGITPIKKTRPSPLSREAVTVEASRPPGPAPGTSDRGLHARSLPERTRSTIIERSNWANAPMICMRRVAAGLRRSVSIPCETERSFAWLGRNRRLSKDYEYLVQTAETFIDIAATRLMLNRIAP